MSTINRKAIRAKVRRRIRRKVSGTASRPRLAVYFSNRHVYAQIIDDTVGKTICSSLRPTLPNSPTALPLPRWAI